MIELVIVVALVSVLLTIAAPGYRKHVMRAHRTGAIGMMLQIAACQERRYAAQSHYDTQKCLLQAGDRYVYQYAEPDVANATGYTVLAQPVGPQAGDYCGALVLDHLGTRTVENGKADPARCWAGR